MKKTHYYFWLQFRLVAMVTMFLHGIKVVEQLWKPFTKENNPANRHCN
jgi:hypothetical protein